MVAHRKTGKPRALEDDPALNDVDDNPLDAETLDEFLRENLRTSEVEVRAPEAGGLPSLAFLQANFKTKSAAIRYMHSVGHKPAVIAKHLGFRYQHVRNVLKTELKRGPNEDFHLPGNVATPDPGTEDEGEVQEGPAVSRLADEKQSSAAEEGDW